MEEFELNPPPPINDVFEATFRERAIERLVTEHADLPERRLASWLMLLEDPDPRARVMATTAVWTMMDVRDLRR